MFGMFRGRGRQRVGRSRAPQQWVEPLEPRVLLATVTSVEVALLSGTGSAHASKGGINPGLIRARSVSDGGRFIAFESLADDLLPDDSDTNGVTDIYLVDREDVSITRLSLTNDGQEIPEASRSPQMSADGRFIVFGSLGSLTPDTPDNPNEWNTFLYDVEAETLSLVPNSGNSSGITDPDISADGSTIAFSAGGRFRTFVRLYDRVSGQVTAITDETAIAASKFPSLSATGRYVAYESDINETSDRVYRYDRVTGQTILISKDSTGDDARADKAGISGDGNLVSFQSFDTDLIGPGVPGFTQVFVYDVDAGTTTMVSKNAGGTRGDGTSVGLAVFNGDGSRLVFESFASNLLPEDTNRDGDVYLWERDTDTLQLLSADVNGTKGNGESLDPFITNDGSIVMFFSQASNLAPGEHTAPDDQVLVNLEQEVVVNSTDDDEDTDPGDGVISTGQMITINGTSVPKITLRAALMEYSEQDETQTVKFRIPANNQDGVNFANGVWTIQPDTPLEITGSLIIDGYSQTGASPATDTEPAELKIVVNGSSAGTDANGFEIETDPGDEVEVRGLVVNGFDGSGILVRESSDVTIAGNHIGTNAAGDDDVANGFGIRLIETADSTVGGLTPADRNVVSGNDSDGLRIELGTSTNNTVIGNYFGTDADGTADLGNGGDGVAIDNATGNTVGGDTDAARNILSGNTGAGVSITGGVATENSVLGNYIGTGFLGVVGIPNELAGVFVSDLASRNTVGGVATGEGNLIMSNDASPGEENTPGVWINGGTENAVLSNTIYDNEGLAIDLGEQGILRNQETGGANNAQNFPVLIIDPAGTINVSLDAAPTTQYRIEVYSSDKSGLAGYGDGQTLLSSFNVTTDGMGMVRSDAPGITAPADKFIAATATRIDTTGGTPRFTDTSEFSDAVKRGSLPSVTVVTHGFVPQIGADGDTLKPLADAIVERTDGNLVDYQLEQGGQGQFITSVSGSKHNVVLFDWASESNEDSSGWSEAGADALFALLVQQGLLDPSAGAGNGNLHFLAHSFGAALTSDVVERLAVYGVPVDHLTYLDPHDFDETFGIPFDQTQNEFEIGRPQLSPLGSEHYGLNYGATVWTNVDYADTYFQNRSIGNGPDGIFPESRPILGSFNFYLDTELPLDDGFFEPYSSLFDSDHSWVWNVFYQGTVEGNGGRTDGASPEIRVPDYGALGYAFSRALGSVNERLDPFFPTTPTPETGAGGSGPNKWTHPSLDFSDPAVRFDPLWDPLEIVNGDFEHPGTVVTGNLVDIVPGWSHHGGGGEGNIGPDRGEDSTENHYLELDFGDSSRTHNYLYVPHQFDNLFLEWDMLRDDASSDDQLVVTMDDGSGSSFEIARLNLDVEDTAFAPLSFPVPADRLGTVQRITFEVVDGGSFGTVDSQTLIDNVRWSETRTGVSGTKFEDDNGNGQRDAGEDGLEGFTIYADLNNNMAFDVDEPNTTTRSDGTYTLKVPAGSYTIREVVPEGWVQTTAHPGVVDVPNDVIVEDIDFGNFKLMNFSGVKYNDVNGNGMRDAEDDVIEGWTIQVFNDTGVMVGEDTTDFTGRWEIEGLGPDDTNDKFFVLEVPDDDWVITEQQPAEGFDLESGFDRTDLNFGNFRKGEIHGYKFEDLNKDGQDNDQARLENIIFLLDVDADKNGTFETTLEPVLSTGPGARWSFTGLGPGRYRVREDLPANMTQTTGDIPIIELESGDVWMEAPGAVSLSDPQQTEQVEATLAVGNYTFGEIHGFKYEDKDGNKSRNAAESVVPGIEIILRYDADEDGVFEQEFNTTTDALGEYHFTGLNPGFYQVAEAGPPDFYQTTDLPPVLVVRSGDFYEAFTNQAPGTPGSLQRFHTEPLLVIGNFYYGQIHGYKFDDTNGNGVEDAGEPRFAGVTIRLQIDEDEDGVFERSVTTVSADVTGEYWFTGLERGRYFVAEDLPDGTVFTTPTAPIITLQSGDVWQAFAGQVDTAGLPRPMPQVEPNLALGNFTLFDISGTKFLDLNGNGVRDENDPGIADWPIELDLDRNGTIDAVTLTDSAGNYAFTDVGPGDHWVFEQTFAEFEQTFPGVGAFARHEVEAESGVDVTGLDFGNRSLQSVVAGTKYNDLNRDGVRDVGELGLLGWVIYYDANNDGVLNNPTSGDNVADENATEPWVVTDDNGNYALVVQPGGVVLREVLQPTWEQSFPASGFHAVNIAQVGDSIDGLDFGNFEQRAIAGTKFNDVNGNGARDPGELGLAGWTTELRNASDVVVDTEVTDANGDYRFTGVEAGTYTVTEVAQPGFVQTFPANGASQGPIVLTDPIQVEDIDFGNFALMSVSGVKFDDLNGNGTRDPGEPGVAGVTVELDVDQDGLADEETTTGPDGSYQFTDIGPRDDLSPGSFTVREVVPDGAVQTAPTDNGGEYVHAIISGQSIVGDDFGNFTLGIIRGQVFDDDDQDGVQDRGEGGVDGSTVFIDANTNGVFDDGEPNVVTGPSGDYEFIDLELDTYVVGLAPRDNFVQTAPGGGTHTVVIDTSGQVEDDRDFGSFLTGVDIQFGDGFFNSVKLVSGDETQTISLTKGTGSLRVTGDNLTTEEGRRDLTVMGDNVELLFAQVDTGDLKTRLNFAVKGGDKLMEIGDLIVNSSIGTVSGKSVNVLGDVLITGTAKTIQFNDVADDHLIKIGPPESDRDSVNITLRHVRETDLMSDTPIRRLTVAQWDDEDGDPDQIMAPFMGGMNVKGDRRADLPGDFAADVILSGFGATRDTLGPTNIFGTLSQSVWDIVGNISTVNARGNVSDWSLTLASTFRTINMGDASNVHIDVPDDGGLVKFKRWIDGSYIGGSVKGFNSTGARRANIPGDASFDVDLTGHSDDRKPTVGNVRFTGGLLGGKWTVIGDGQGFNVDYITPAWSGDFTGDIRTISTKGNLSGTLTANSVSTINVRDSAIALTLNLTQPPLQSNTRLVGLNRLNVKNTSRNLTINAAGFVNTIQTGTLFDSTIYAGIADTVVDLPNVEEDYETGATIRSLSVKGLRDEPFAFGNTVVAAKQLDKITVGLAMTDNGGSLFGFGATFIASLKVDTDQGAISVKNLLPGSGPDPIGDLQVRLV